MRNAQPVRESEDIEAQPFHRALTRPVAKQPDALLKHAIACPRRTYTMIANGA
jgi:hypothetical protein